MPTSQRVLTASLLAAAILATASRAQVAGVVSDLWTRPLSGVVVVLEGPDATRRDTTDSLGRFTFNVPNGFQGNVSVREICSLVLDRAVTAPDTTTHLMLRPRFPRPAAETAAFLAELERRRQHWLVHRPGAYRFRVGYSGGLLMSHSTYEVTVRGGMRDVVDGFGRHIMLRPPREASLDSLFAVARDVIEDECCRVEIEYDAVYGFVTRLLRQPLGPQEIPLLFVDWAVHVTEFEVLPPAK